MTAGLNCRISVLKDVSGRLHPYRVNSEELVVRSASGGTSCPPSISVTSTHLSHFSTLTSLWFIFNPQSRSTEPKQIRPNSFTLQVFFFTSAHPCTYCKPKLLRCKAEMINLTEVKTSHSYTQIWTPQWCPSKILFILYHLFCAEEQQDYKWFGFGVKLCALAFEKGNKRTKCSNNSVKGEGGSCHSGSRSSPSSSSAKSSSSPRFLAPVFGLSIWGPSGSTYEASANEMMILLTRAFLCTLLKIYTRGVNQHFRANEHHAVNGFLMSAIWGAEDDN